MKKENEKVGARDMKFKIVLHGRFGLNPPVSISLLFSIAAQDRTANSQVRVQRKSTTANASFTFPIQ